MYTVIRRFSDAQDNNRVYEIGEAFPREGLSVSKERVAELAGRSNRLGVPIIKAQKAKKKAE